MKKSKINLEKKDVKFVKFKTANIIPMFDLAVSIDKFLDELKHSSKIPDDKKTAFLESFNKMILNINDVFVKQAKKYEIEFEEPFSVKVLKERKKD